jgi:mgtE-like transporter
MAERNGRRRRRLPFARVLAYWRAERRTIRQGLVANVVSALGSLVAGLILGSITGTLDAVPGLMVLVPAAIGMRGNIFGALASRLGTSLHTGLFERSRQRGGQLSQNLAASAVLTVAISLLLAVIAKGLSASFGLRSVSIADLVVISVLGGILSSIVVGAFTVALSLQAHARGWDLDSVAAPLVTTIGDLVTLPALVMATWIAGVELVTPVVAGVASAVALAAVVRGVRSAREITRRVVRESLPLLVLVGALDILAGIVVESRIDRFLALPALLVLVPALNENVGALGAILAARLASKLHLGALSPRGRPEPVALLDTTIVFLFGLVLFAMTGVVTFVAAGWLGMSSPGMLTVVGISLLAGMAATCVAVLIGYYVAIASYRFGFDPDNVGVPVITSSMDLVAVLSLILALFAFGLA